MALDKQVQAAVEALIELGVLNEDGLRKLGGFFESLKAFSTSRPVRKTRAIVEPLELPVKGDKAEEVATPVEAKQAPDLEPEPEEKPYVIKSSLWEEPASRNGNHRPAQKEAEHDPEFSQELPGEYGQSGFEEQDKQARRKALPGFAPGYDENNLKKEPIQFRKRAPRGSFNLPAAELQKLRAVHTVKQIATSYGVSPATVNNKLREYGLTDPSKGRPRK